MTKGTHSNQRTTVAEGLSGPSVKGWSWKLASLVSCTHLRASKDWLHFCNLLGTEVHIWRPETSNAKGGDTATVIP